MDVQAAPRNAHEVATEIGETTRQSVRGDQSRGRRIPHADREAPANRRGESLEDQMDVMLANGKIANKRARCRSAEDARVAMEIRGVTTDAYWIAVIGHAVFVYWFQER